MENALKHRLSTKIWFEIQRIKSTHTMCMTSADISRDFQPHPLLIRSSLFFLHQVDCLLSSEFDPEFYPLSSLFPGSNHSHSLIMECRDE
jgi:hypothetical protein